MPLNAEAVEVTPNEAELMEWCHAILTEEQIADCQDEAMELAGAELHQQEAAELLVRLYARMMVRNVRGQNGG